MPFVGAGAFPGDTQGFTPPVFGGTVAVMIATVTYEDSTARTIFTLPEDAMVIDITVDVAQAFNDSGTDFLDVGIPGTGDYFIDGLDVDTEGVHRYGATGFEPKGFITFSGGEMPITAQFLGQNGNADEGSAIIAFYYITGVTLDGYRQDNA
jgi:hypothetical protein